MSLAIAVSILLLAVICSAQQTLTISVPNLVRYGGTLKDAQGSLISSTTVGVTFAIYKQQDGGAAVWMETQNVTTDAAGNYSALLGSTTAAGLPSDLFSQQEQRWLGVQVQGQAEQPRVLLVSVPYAFKAHEAETLGGMSISDFVLAKGANSPANGSNASQTSSTASQPSASKPGTGNPPPSGPTNFSGSTTNQIVGVTQTGTGAGVSATASSKAVVGTATAASGTAYGVEGVASGTGGNGVVGIASSTTGANFGVKGATASTSGTGVRGQSTAATGSTIGVSGYVESSSGIAGVFNNAAGGKILSGQNNGTEKFAVDGAGNITTSGAIKAPSMLGTTSAATGVGLTGDATNTTGANTGVLGETASSNGVGVNGMANATTGQNVGVYGQSNSTSGWGLYGDAAATTGQTAGVEGLSNSSGQFSAGVLGYQNSTTGLVFGVSGQTNSMTTNASGVSGYEGAATGQVFGVSGGTNSISDNAAGVNGYEGATTGQVFGVNGSTNSISDNAAGVNGYEGGATGNTRGVVGASASTGGYGVYGDASATTGFTVGVFGDNHSSGGIGVLGKVQTAGGTAGVFANTAGSGLILQALSGLSYQEMFHVDASGNGFYAGNLNVTGTLTKGGGSFKIDDPLDPENKTLSHSFVESPDMMNLYNGSARLDARGDAWVTMPDYFQALNRDFQYVLTSVGSSQPRLYIAREIEGNRFKIAGGRPNGKVSWMVTGIRQDAWANAHRIPTEQDKPAAERGTYLYPDLVAPTGEKNINASLQR
jgi:hypothetical protein